VTYLLASGGHNVGIVSEPGVSGKSFQVITKKRDDPYIPPETYLAQAPQCDGSWWPQWAAWLNEHSGAMTAPPSIKAVSDGMALCDAPGTYVLQD
jgi:polyhydroxyalkanoate synthase